MTILSTFKRDKLCQETGWHMDHSQLPTGVRMIAIDPPSPANGQQRWFANSDMLDQFLLAASDSENKSY